MPCSNLHYVVVVVVSDGRQRGGLLGGRAGRLPLRPGGFWERGDGGCCVHAARPRHPDGKNPSLDFMFLPMPPRPKLFLFYCTAHTSHFLALPMGKRPYLRLSDVALSKQEMY